MSSAVRRPRWWTWRAVCCCPDSWTPTSTRCRAASNGPAATSRRRRGWRRTRRRSRGTPGSTRTCRGSSAAAGTSPTSRVAHRRRPTWTRCIGDRPAFLVNADHHGAWVNSRALALAGIDARTPDPPDGRIERGPDGAPTGTLHEGAMDLVGRLVPPTTHAELVAALLDAQAYLHSLGITGWQDAILGDYANIGDATPAYVELARGRPADRAGGRRAVVAARPRRRADPGARRTAGRPELPAVPGRQP